MSSNRSTLADGFRARHGMVLVCTLGGVLSCCLVYGVVADNEIIISPVLLKVIEEVEVPALQEGPVTQIHVAEGEVVQIGQPLVQIDDQRAMFRSKQAELEHKIATKKGTDQSELELAETEARVAASSLQRALDSRKKFRDTPSQAEVDDIELRVAQAKQHLDQAKHLQQLAELAKELSQSNLALATFELERHKIKSPIQGAIIEIIARRGEWVRPGEPLVRVMRIDRLRVEGFIKRAAITPGLLDRQITIMIEGSEGERGKHPGKIVFISPEVDPNDGTQRIVAEVDNSKGLLGPGLRAKMLIPSR